MGSFREQLKILLSSCIRGAVGSKRGKHRSLTVLKAAALTYPHKHGQIQSHYSLSQEIPADTSNFSHQDNVSWCHHIFPPPVEIHAIHLKMMQWDEGKNIFHLQTNSMSRQLKIHLTPIILNILHKKQFEPMANWVILLITLRFFYSLSNI